MFHQVYIKYINVRMHALINILLNVNIDSCLLRRVRYPQLVQTREKMTLPFFFYPETHFPKLHYPLLFYINKYLLNDDSNLESYEIFKYKLQTDPRLTHIKYKMQ